MSALDTVKFDAGGFGGAAEAVLRQAVAKGIWAWYDQHSNDVLFEKGIWKFKITIRLSELRFLIEQIAGPRPFPT